MGLEEHCPSQTGGGTGESPTGACKGLLYPGQVRALRDGVPGLVEHCLRQAGEGRGEGAPRSPFRQTLAIA